MSTTSHPAHNTEAIPVSIVTGFLGAGKTTLINWLLKYPEHERLGVLVNDFGALNIDAKLVTVRSENQISLSNGCVCCSIQDDLAGALITLARARPRLTRIVVECSGVSHPSGVLAVFDNDAVSAVANVDGIFCLVDTEQFGELDFKDTELAIDQAAMSDLVLLNKIDLAPDLTICQVERTLRGAQPHIRMDRVAQAVVPPAVLFGAQHLRVLPDNAGSTHSNHEDDYETISLSWDEPLQLDKFQAFVASFPPGVLRAKGILSFREPNKTEVQRGIFQLVGKRSSLAFDAEQQRCPSQLVLIAKRETNLGQVFEGASMHCLGFRRIEKRRQTVDGRSPFFCN